MFLPPVVREYTALDRLEGGAFLMYTAYYGFSEKPFNITPDPKFVFLSRQHREALAHLLYGIRERGGFIEITGEIGAGKTTLCRTLLGHLDDDTSAALIFNPDLTATELLQSINEELGIPIEGVSKKALVNALNTHLLAEREKDRNVVLIIDEAQDLQPSVLEQIRLLSNLETDTEKLIQIVLMGQPELREILARPELKQLNQRITVRYHLASLDREETARYIEHRLDVAGGANKVRFTANALRSIHRRTRGIPRLINVLCDRCLLAGFSAGVKTIAPALVTASLREIKGMPVKGAMHRSRPLVKSLAAVVVILVAVGGFVLFDREESPRTEGNRLGLNPEAAQFPAETTVLIQSGSPLHAAERISSTTPDAPPADRSLPLMNGKVSPLADEPEEEDRLEKLDHRGQDGARWKGVDVGPQVPIPLKEGFLEEEAPSSMETLRTREGDVPGSSANIIRSARAYLLSLSPRESLEGSLRAISTQWSVKTPLDLPYSGPVSANLNQFDSATGLEHLPAFGNLGLLRVLDLPALLEINLPGEQEPRFLALTKIHGDFGVFSPWDEEGMRVPLSLLDELWYGRAYVFWKDFESLPDLLGPGSVEEEVGWLQDTLKRLGLFRGEPTLIYGEETQRAVHALQRANNLTGDGIFGPFTKIILYRSAEEYSMPSLSTKEVTTDGPDQEDD